MQLKHFVGLSALVAGAAFMAGRVSAEGICENRWLTT